LQSNQSKQYLHIYGSSCRQCIHMKQQTNQNQIVEEEEQDECYDCHEMEFIENLEGVADQYVRMLYACIYCGHTKVITKSIGVRD
jgi:predicted CXXCH cytochrome family protein